TSDSITVAVATDYPEYTKFQNIKILVSAFSEKGGTMELVVEQRNSANSLISNTSYQTLVNVTDYVFNLQVPGKPGTYSITVKAIQNGNIGTSFTSFSVVYVYDTNTVKLMFVAMIFFAALLILIIASKENNATEEILRFLFLSGIVASILLSLLFTQLEYGASSAVGLMRSSVPATNETAFANLSAVPWVFHIGNKLFIPLYVVVFGLIGGYLRYLYKTSRLFLDKDLRKDTEDLTKYLTDQKAKDVGRRVIFCESLKDLSLFFLAPILAIVAWFLFSQWELIADSDTLLAVFSFSAGLVTTEIVNGITNFTKRNLIERTTAG
ncbi:MAG: hypothetical protein WBL64_02510, partial [Nitrososphaeraceae archaeon]